jgi:hypothetical protein
MVGGCLAAIAIGLGACQRGPSPEELALNESKAENARLQGELQARDSLIGDMTLSFDEIERNLALVEEKEKLVTSEAEGAELGMDKRQQIVRDIQLMNGLMKESRDKIAELEKRLDKSNIEAGGLRKKLKDLDAQLAMRDSAIAGMKDELLARDFKITQINDQLTAIELEIAKREAIIQQQEHEINKAYLVMGTYEELEQQGVLVKEGGVVGIGKHVALRNDASTARFKEVDVRDLKTVPLNVEKANLVTEHPKASYEIVEQNDQMAYLEIKDPSEFWRLSKYLVVEVK